jgi:hypothetical protein
MTRWYILLLAIIAFMVVVIASIILMLVAIFASRMMLTVLVTENLPLVLVALSAWISVALWIRTLILIRDWFKNENRIWINRISFAERVQILAKARWFAKMTSIISLFTTLLTILGFGSLSIPWTLTTGIATAPAFAFLLTGATTFALTDVLANSVRDLENNIDMN